MRKKQFYLVVLSVLLAASFSLACSNDEPTETTVEQTTTAAETTAATEAPTPTPEETTAATDETQETTEAEPDPSAEGTPELIWHFEYEDEEFASSSIAMHPDGELVTVGTYLATYTHRLYDGEVTAVDTDYRHRVEHLSYSPDGQYLAAGLSVYGSNFKDVTETNESVQLHGGHNNFVAFSPDGEFLATGNRSAEIWIWSIPDGEQVAELSDGEGGYLWGLAYHPSGEQIASLQWRDDGVINIWSISDEEIIHSMVPNILVGSTHHAICYSPDGSLFGTYFSEDWEHSIRLFETDTYEMIIDILIGHRVSHLSFSPDGQMVAVASIYAPVTIWSTSTGDLLYTLDQEIESTDGSQALAFTPDGGHLGVVRNGSGDLELWRLPGADPLPEPEIDIYQPVPIPGDVLFDTGSSSLKAEADAVLQQLAEDIYQALPEAKLTFIGHTDSRGDAASNMQLSIDRATSVREWFEDWAENSGADGWLFEVEGKGETELKTPDVDSEGNFRDEAGRVNRRVEIDLEPTG